MKFPQREAVPRAATHSVLGLFRRVGSVETNPGGYFSHGVRINGFVGSSLVGFFSLFVFFSFMTQFYAF
jgi:hypothetical protein